MAAQGRLDDAFVALIDGLRAQADAQARGDRGDGERPWQVPPEIASVQDVPGIVAGFDRAASNANYEELIGDSAAGGTAGDVVGVKAQVDYVATLERGFRARHCSPVRCRALASGRRAAHGQARGVLGGVVRYAQDAIKAGRS